MADQPLQSPFCIIPTGLPAITTPTTQPAPLSYLFTLPTVRPFNHIVVFLLPGIELPPDTAAAVYISLPPSSPTPPATIQPEFKFLGGIGAGKESAVFKISGLLGANTNINGSAAGGSTEIDMDAPESTLTTSREIIIGISIESAESVSAQIATLKSPSSSETPTSSALVLSKPAQQQKPDTLVMAQRIIKNAFNFLASFSGNVNGGVEVVPLKAFEEWWRKFEGRIRSDPGFLERDGGD